MPGMQEQFQAFRGWLEGGPQVLAALPNIPPQTCRVGLMAFRHFPACPWMDARWRCYSSRPLP